MVRIRHCQAADAEALAAIYRDAACNLGRQGYTEEQTAVWARHPDDLERFRATLGEGLTLCAEVDQAPVAFGQLHPPDHIAYLYCHSAHARRGYAAGILARLEDHAASRGVATLRVEASRVARPFFERAGYCVIAEERPVRHGVEFVRYRMAKQLPERQNLPPDA
jgi:putative acetyltransferase